MHPNNGDCDILVTLTTFGYPFIPRCRSKDEEPMTQIQILAFTPV